MMKFEKFSLAEELLYRYKSLGNPTKKEEHSSVFYKDEDGSLSVHGIGKIIGRYHIEKAFLHALNTNLDEIIKAMRGMLLEKIQENKNAAVDELVSALNLFGDLTTK
jgi:hypothetical protein